jgi:hypothetical protein
MTIMFKRIKPYESFLIRHPKTNKYHKNNHYRQIHYECHQHLDYYKHNNLNKQVMSPNKIETLNFDGRYDPWIFDMWTCDMNQFFD